VKVRAGRRSIQVGNPDKMFFPDDGITKAEVVEYYAEIAPHMLPHVKDRPVSMHRFPDGIEGHGFYHKDAPGHFPDWITRVRVKKEGGKLSHVVVDNGATLAYLAEQGCITPHIWLSRTHDLHRPDRMIFDLDPSDEDFEDVRAGARFVKDVLDALDLFSLPMVSGSRGIHVVVPLRREQSFEEVRPLARDISKLVAARHPDRLTVEARKEKRKGRILIDYFRNAYAQTTVAPYAVRALPGAPVATPISWDELGGRRLGPRTYHLGNIRRRVSTVGDPWEGIARRARTIGDRRKVLDEMLEEA
jgi:bifunctional non-homologous end joining protein LigD